ncbi:MAG: tRNA-specific 2-thiouridylase MnmA [Gammaproteobacteria bacterium]|nr:MAG: tRNA-specific 2-thiouridylase MnmA [Gammaproteobacteria bacterium]
MRREHIIVGMSGGVDSSVAALLLLEQGHRVEGLFMKNWEETDDVAYCTAQQDLEDAERVCEDLEIPLHTVNFARQYWDRVFAHFLAEQRAGRTPNPDVLCNREIKFQVFLEHALRLGADRIATGHYARIDAAPDGGRRLLKGVDPGKDQSYFLHALGQRELARSVFPLGGLCKAEVRARATEAGLVTHDKRDSTGICFIGERRFADFLARYLPPREGDIVTLDGRVIGRHRGAWYYTIGQRQGLGIGGVAGAPEAPWYVVAKDVEKNTVTVVQGADHPALFARRVRTGPIHWIGRPPAALPFRCAAKTRYRQPDQPCTLLEATDAGAECLFDTPQRAVTPGQSLVLYAGEVCLGGAVIEQTRPE